MFMYRFKFFFAESHRLFRGWPTKRDENEGTISLYDRVNTVKARKIMNSYETNDSAFFYFFLFVFQESLVEAEIGRQKPSSDEEHQKIDSGARYNTKEFRLTLFKMKNF